MGDIIFPEENIEEGCQVIRGENILSKEEKFLKGQVL